MQIDCLPIARSSPLKTRRWTIAKRFLEYLEFCHVAGNQCIHRLNRLLQVQRTIGRKKQKQVCLYSHKDRTGSFFSNLSWAPRRNWVSVDVSVYSPTHRNVESKLHVGHSWSSWHDNAPPGTSCSSSICVGVAAHCTSVGPVQQGVERDGITLGLSVQARPPCIAAVSFVAIFPGTIVLFPIEQSVFPSLHRSGI